MKKTLGGDRLGSGNNMKVEMHNYERSTHNLGNTFRTTAAPGVLIPFYKKLALNGDTWDFNLSTLVRTAPANGPLFGSYKLQLDMFTVPIRLYNGILHNNMIKIGLNMNQVKLPMIKTSTVWKNPQIETIQSWNTSQVSSSSLMAYLGFRGYGDVVSEEDNPNNIQLTRNVQAVPFLAYYDIFKNYYANKQEEKAYVISSNGDTVNSSIESVTVVTRTNEGDHQGQNPTTNSEKYNFKISNSNNTQVRYQTNNIVNVQGQRDYLSYYDAISTQAIQCQPNRLYSFKCKGYIDTTEVKIVLCHPNQSYAVYYLDLNDQTKFEYTVNGDVINVKFKQAFLQNYVILYLLGIEYNEGTYNNTTLKLKSFALDNIDKMRIDILKSTELDQTFQVEQSEAGQNYPYKALWETTQQGTTYNWFKENGLVLKTYQSDIYQNWLSTETIEGATGINALSAVDTSSGSFTIDALNLSHKVYNMMNRIAVSGGTYEDWQEAVYGEDALRRAESPVYEGGMSAEIVFEEVVSTADTETEAAGDQALGSLAGKGTLANIKGGNVTIKIKEPSYIIGIMSITPRIDYCEGNDFDLTEIESLDDLHKPELDQIGFQDLKSERLAWWGKVWDSDSQRWIDQKIGKSPAWIDYMTSVNQVYGEFAEDNGLNYMVLTRHYERGARAYPANNITDATTYINPTKFNYTFTNRELDAQNFWVQIGINATSRRKMSAKIMPNL